MGGLAWCLEPAAGAPSKGGMGHAFTDVNALGSDARSTWKPYCKSTRSSKPKTVGEAGENSRPETRKPGVVTASHATSVASG